jgi:1H-pyrrole-2-carbonyl-[peptidyl-carrier protein] chlorinase
MSTNGSPQEYDADVIVIGGGPAGSAMSSYLAMNGYRVALFEREIHPREHVGESLVPATNRVLEDIGFWDKMGDFGWVPKPGATWTSFGGRIGSEIVVTFADVMLENINQDYTYHVDRARFDNELLKHAQTLGAQVIEGANVLKVNFDDAGRATGVTARFLGKELDFTSRFVVDASGRRGLLGKQLGLWEKDSQFDQMAVYSWFEDVKPPAEETKDYIHIHFLPIERGWVWQIPIYEGVTSVGVVVEKEVFQKSGKDYEAFFEEVVQLSNNTKHILEGAKRVRPFYIEGDYSYKMKKFAGDGWMLVGDAARFVDPIFSSGVSVAVNSAKFAFEAIEEAVKTGDSLMPLEAYNDKVQHGVAIWYEWITIYYRLQSLFTYLGRDPKNKAEMQKLLQGDVYDEDAVEVLGRMKALVKAVEDDPNHLLRKHLSDNVTVVTAS